MFCKRWATPTSGRWPAAGRPGRNQARRSRLRRNQTNRSGVIAILSVRFLSKPESLQSELGSELAKISGQDAREPPTRCRRSKGSSELVISQENTMRKLSLLVTLLLVCTFAPLAFGREAKLVRYPSYSNGRIAFTYLGDIWTADETGQNIQRLTVNKARDAYPRFSPDGKWIAFSSNRNGNLDVFIIASGGGTAKQLTFHSADDTVLGWTPDGRGVLFSSQRGEDFMGMLYVVSVDGGMPTKAGTDMGN